MKTTLNKAPGRSRCSRAAVGLLMLLTACTDSSQPPKKTVVATPIDPATAATIQVEVRYEGTVPAAKQIDMGAVPRCAEAHAEPVYDTALVVQDGRLTNAIVWIKEGLQGLVLAPPSDPVVIDQVGCLYQPRVAAAMVGQPVEFRNSDPEPHNVRARPQVVRSWNFMIARKGAAQTLSFDKSEVAIPLGCDIHPWMRGYLAVVDHPYFAVTPANGSVTLSQVPPGEYVVGVWHETLGTKEQRVTLDPRGSVSMLVTYQAP